MIRPVQFLIPILLVSTSFGQLIENDPERAQLESLIEQTDLQIANALDRYNQLLAEQEDTKLEKIRAINELENRIVDLQQKERRNALLASQWQQEAQNARELREEQEGQANYVDGVLIDYINKFENRAHPAELQTLLPQLTQKRNALDTSNLGYEQRISTQLDIVSLGISRIRDAIGGNKFQGKSIDEDGSLVSGTFVLLGPTAYFDSDQSSASSGIAIYNGGTIEPRIHSVDTADSDEIAKLVQTGTGTIPLDASLGKALSLRKEQGDIWSHIQKGGWVGYVILALGALSLAVSAQKAISLRANQPRIQANYPQLLRRIDEDGARILEELPESQTDLKALVQAGIENLKASETLREEAILSKILEYKLRLEKALPFIAVTAATAPLLGLLGTVVGMIKTFTLITIFGTGDAKSLSGGISEALVTTELGLIIAIPALIAHSMLQRKIKSNTNTLEKAAFEFIKSTDSHGKQSTISD